MGEVTRSKVFNDPIHGHIELPPLCVKIVDTPHFQRLRNIKQLGACYLVYPGASHNRFEHCLGVCHLAGTLLKAIKENQTNLLTSLDILCVQIAGLCHDLGQGPFSYLFEKEFIRKYDPEWKFEKASEQMFDHLLRTYNDGQLYADFLEKGLDEKDITFIKEMINPPDLRPGEWPFKGRGKDKAFLYRVVTNKVTGIDVDRWDSLARDCYMLGMKSIFDFNRCLAVARVLTLDDGRTQICYREKEAQDIYDMFYTRITLHRRAYKHKTNNILGRMVVDAMVEAKDHLTFIGQNGVVFNLGETVKDMEAYAQVTDDILNMILQSTKPELDTSKTIIRNIMTRNLYKVAGQTQIKQNGPLDEHTFKEELLKKIKEKNAGFSVQTDYIVFDIVKLNFGLDDKDPLKNVRFYSKHKEDEPILISKQQVSYVLPDTFSEQIVRVFCKKTSEENIQIVRDSFDDWCHGKGYPRPKDRQTVVVANNGR